MITSYVLLFYIHQTTVFGLIDGTKRTELIDIRFSPVVYRIESLEDLKHQEKYGYNSDSEIKERTKWECETVLHKMLMVAKRGGLEASGECVAE